MVNEVSARLKAPPKRGRGRCSMVECLRHTWFVAGEGASEGSSWGLSCLGFRKATRNPSLRARSLIFSSSRSLLAVTTMLCFEWQSRMITSVLGAVSPAAFLVSCMFVAFKVNTVADAKEKRPPLRCYKHDCLPRRGFMLRKVTAMVGRSNKKSPDCVSGLFPPPLRDGHTIMFVALQIYGFFELCNTFCEKIILFPKIR